MDIKWGEDGQFMLVAEKDLVFFGFWLKDKFGIQVISYFLKFLIYNNDNTHYKLPEAIKHYRKRC